MADSVLADIGRTFQSQTEGATVQSPTTGDSEALQMERQFLGMARDMNEVLVSKLHDAAAADDLAALKECLNDNSNELNKQDAAGNTPAHWAAGNGAVNCLQYLIDLDCDLNLQNSLGDNVLHRAIWRCQVECVKLIVNSGIIDVTMKNKAELVPADLAKTEELKKIMEGLVPLHSVQSSMLVPEEDIESSNDDASGDEDGETGDNDVNTTTRIFVGDDFGQYDFIDTKPDTYLNTAEESSDGEEPVETLIVVQESDSIFHSNIVAIGHKKQTKNVLEAIRGPPPPVPSRSGRPSLNNAVADEKRFADVDDDDDDNDDSEKNDISQAITDEGLDVNTPDDTVKLSDGSDTDDEDDQMPALEEF